MICGIANSFVQPSGQDETRNSPPDTDPKPSRNSLDQPDQPQLLYQFTGDMNSASACKRVLFKDIALLWTGIDQHVLSDCSIFVDNGIIQWVGRHDHIPSSLISSDYVVEDMRNRLVTPGLINTHHHMYQSLTKCIARESQLFEWLQTLFPIWNHLTPDMVYKSARFAIAELLLSGCTLASDLLYLYPNGVTLDDTIRAAKELGIRFQPCRGAISVGESDGGLPPDSLCEDEDDILIDMERLIDEYHDPRDGAMVRIALAPCSPFSVSEALMIKTAELARTYENVMLHTHFAENTSDMEYMKTTVQKGLVEFLEHCQWNRSDCWFAHCVKLSDESTEGMSSIDYFAKKGLGVAHCPVSNCRLASGIAPIRKMLDKGVNVGIGVDGSASNDSGNLLSEARMALMVARVKDEKADAMSTTEALQIATSGGAAVLGRTDVGTIKAGMCADMVAWRLDTPTFAGSVHSEAAVLSALILGNGGDLKADYVMVNGKVVVRDGELTGGNNMSQITREHNAAALQLAASAGEIMRGGKS